MERISLPVRLQESSNLTWQNGWIWNVCTSSSGACRIQSSLQKFLPHFLLWSELSSSRVGPFWRCSQAESWHSEEKKGLLLWDKYLKFLVTEKTLDCSSPLRKNFEKIPTFCTFYAENLNLFAIFMQKIWIYSPFSCSK